MYNYKMYTSGMFNNPLTDLAKQNDRIKFLIKRDILKTVKSPTA